MAEISVIIPVYNVKPYLARCLDSVRAQTFSDLEIILVDDGSTDGSADVCDQYAALDTRVRALHQENQGASAARNAGIDAATGACIAFIDSDDEILPQMMETLYVGLVENRADVAMCNLTEVCTDGTERVHLPQMETGVVQYGTFDLESLKKTMFGTIFSAGVCGGLFRRSIIDELQLRFISMKKVLAEDQLFHLCYYTHVRTAYYCAQPMYRYDRRDDSLTGPEPKPDAMACWLRFVQTLEDFVRRQDVPCPPFAYFAEYAWSCVLRCTNRKDYDGIVLAFSLIDKQTKRYLNRCLRCLIFGKGGAAYANRTGVRGKALLYQKMMWFLMLLGKYDRPIRTNLLTVR